MDQRRTDSGHISLIVTDLCAAGIDQVRECRDSEAPGVIITAYANIASDYTKALIVLPVLGHFSATDDVAQIPVLSSGASLRAAQIQYWRDHLRPYLPRMTQERYVELRRDLERFDAGRTVRKFLTMEFIGTMLSSHKYQDTTEPIALVDPTTKELIPDGRWREAVGTQQMRSAVVITAPATLEQEMRLVRYLEKPPSRAFNVMSENCSDFVEGALLSVYGDAGLHFRPRRFDFADAWITSPLLVATGFVSYAKERGTPLRVVFLPITAGTRRSRFSVHSLSRGALVPDPNQGKVAFGLKTYFSVLNPLLGTTGFAVDQLSKFVNLPRLIHDCGEGDLLSIGTKAQPCLGETVDHRDRVRVFGTTSCWRKKRSDFQQLTLQALEIGLLNHQEGKLLLKQDQPFLLPRLYEHPVLDKSQSQSLLAGMRSCFNPDCASPVIAEEASSSSSEPALGQVIPGRPEILLMAESSEHTVKETALKLMVSVINFDFSSEPTDRRTVQAFDKDWQLFIHVAEKSGLSVQSATARNETLEACSCNQFNAGVERQDALQESRGFTQTIMRAERDLVTGPVR